MHARGRVQTGLLSVLIAVIDGSQSSKLSLSDAFPKAHFLKFLLKSSARSRQDRPDVAGPDKCFEAGALARLSVSSVDPLQP